MIDFLFPLTELFRYLLRFRSYEAKMCTARLFHRGSTSLRSNFTWTGRPHQPFLASETYRHWAIPDSEDCIPLCSLVLTQYRNVTDGQTDGFAVAYTAFAKLALRRAAKIYLLSVIC